MSNDYFQFKQFTIHQRRTAMKVGTDGVLIGACAGRRLQTASHAVRPVRRILDVGCGTGVIALMMAQRFPDAHVVGVEIDAEAAAEARDNVKASPFADRVEVVNMPFQEYRERYVNVWGQESREENVEACGEGYDIVVSNPPFFDNSLTNPDAQRALARHTTTLPFRTLVEGTFALLRPGGTFCVIVPAEVLKAFSAECLLTGFTLQECVAVKTVERKAARRYMLTYCKPHATSLPSPIEMTVCLQSPDGSRSAWYADVMRDFYL